jgi:hypothetical protein
LVKEKENAWEVQLGYADARMMSLLLGITVAVGTEYELVQGAESHAQAPKQCSNH